MDYYLLVLRILHIGAGVFWVGSVLVLAFMINPALQATGETGQKFVDYLIKNRRFGTESSGAGPWQVLPAFCYIGVIHRVSPPPGCSRVQESDLVSVPCSG